MGQSSQTTVQETAPPEWAVPYLQQITQGAQDIYNRGPQSFFPGQTYAGFDPLQLQGQEMALDYASQYGDVLDPALASYTNMVAGGNPLLQSFSQAVPESAEALTGMLMPRQNPYLDQMVNQATTRAGDVFDRSMRSVRDEMQMAGQTQLGPAYTTGLDIASENLGNSVQNITSSMYGNAYNADMNRAFSAATAIPNIYRAGQGTQLQALGMTPQMTQLGLTPSEIVSNVGGQRQSMAQQGISEAMRRYMYQQQAPYQSLMNYANMIGGVAPAWGGTTTGTTEMQQDPLQLLLGAGLTGMGLGIIPTPF